MLSEKQVSSTISYDPLTGRLTWKARSVAFFGGNQKECNRWNARYAGRDALACVSSGGYLTGTIGRKHYRAHRAAWAIYYGEWPESSVDHINGDKTDNRIENLRLANSTENAQNKGKKSNGISCFKGVSQLGPKWKAAINSSRKRTYIGLFNDEVTAAVAYDLFAPIMHGDFARTNLINDKAAMTAFIEDYVRRNCKDMQIAGVRVWQERVAV